MGTLAIKYVRKPASSEHVRNTVALANRVPATAIRVRVERLGNTVVVWHSSKLPALLSEQAQ